MLKLEEDYSVQPIHNALNNYILIYNLTLAGSSKSQETIFKMNLNLKSRVSV